MANLSAVSLNFLMRESPNLAELLLDHFNFGGKKIPVTFLLKAKHVLS